MDVPAVLASVCSAVPGVLGVSGAVLLLLEAPDGIRTLTASDARARWFAEAQQRADMGPLPGAVRTWRPMLTTDLRRLGSPAVAAAAAECGLLSSLVLPFDVDGDRLGVLQLLGDAQRPVEAAHAEALRPLLDALAARLADVRALRRVRPAVDVPVARSDSIVATSVGPQDGPTPNDRVDSGRRSRNRRHLKPGEATTSALPAVPAPRPVAGPRSPVDGRRRGRHSA
jgi:hypothetical protein